MVLKAHSIATLNGCHWDAGHQGHNHTLSLLWECFWWPGMTDQVQKSLKSCSHCLQHEDKLSTVPLHPILSTVPMDLLHVDFTSIEMTMEPNRPPKVANVLVFQDHFMKHIMAYVTPDQTTKTVAKFLNQGCILIFGAPARILSDHGADFMTIIISKMCKLLRLKKLRTMLYHPQTNGLVERSHQTIMWMIGKLGEDEKANWPGHLAEIVHAYNATQSAMMEYSPHYLMFGHRPRLPVNFYFPTLKSAEVPKWGTSTSAKQVDEYLATVWDCLRAALQEAQAQPMAEAQRQKQYYDWKICAIGLESGNHVLIKADAFQGKRKIMDIWENKPHEVVHQIMTDIPSYDVKDWHGNSCILHCNQLLLVVSEADIPLCVGVCQVWDGCNSPMPVKPTPRGSDSKTMPQEDNGLVITQCQARRTSLGWINGKLWLLPWTSTGASTKDGWRFQEMCNRDGCLPGQNGWQACVHLVEG